MPAKQFSPCAISAPASPKRRAKLSELYEHGLPEKLDQFK